jgi:hypothetical protein
MGGYVVVYLTDNSNIQIPFNQNDTSASTTIFCGCGSSCAGMEMIMSIIYSTPTPTSEPLAPTEPPITYFCKDNEFSPCVEQVVPCSGEQIPCGGGEVPFSPS